MLFCQRLKGLIIQQLDFENCAEFFKYFKSGDIIADLALFNFWICYKKQIRQYDLIACIILKKKRKKNFGMGFELAWV